MNYAGQPKELHNITGPDLGGTSVLSSLRTAPFSQMMSGGAAACRGIEAWEIIFDGVNRETEAKPTLRHW